MPPRYQVLEFASTHPARYSELAPACAQCSGIAGSLNGLVPAIAINALRSFEICGKVEKADRSPQMASTCCQTRQADPKVSLQRQRDFGMVL